MAKDTQYYDILGVEPTATDVELKKAYRKQAIKLHPDKNGNDPAAAAKFQELGEAYGILLNKDTRALYDELGVEGMKNDSQAAQAADIDPLEFFKMIFGGDSFRDWIGELSMLDEITKTAEILHKDEAEVEEATEGVTDMTVADSTGQVGKLPTPEEIEKKKKQKISEKQREDLYQLHQQQKEAKIKRINELSQNLLTRVEKYQSVITNKESFAQFNTKFHQELEDLKIESFGIQLLHLMGKTYVDQALATINSCKTFGVSKIYTSMKTKTSRMKSGLQILKTAVDAQATVQELAQQQEEFDKPEAELTDEDRAKQAEFERIVTGKFLATSWASTKFEVTGVLNKVCNKVLNDKNLTKKERIARAEAVQYMGKQMLATQRSADEDEEARVFEEMMADATSKKSKKNGSGLSDDHLKEYMRNVQEEEEEKED